MCDSNVCKYPLQSNYVGGITSFGFDEEGKIRRVAIKLSAGFPTSSNTNRAVQPKKMTRGLKLVEGLYFLCSGNRGADQIRGASFLSHIQNAGFLK